MVRMAPETLNSGNRIIAGQVSTDQLPLKADVYFQGMILEYDAATDSYQALAAGVPAAIFNGVYNADGETLSVTADRDCIVWGEVSKSGFVDGAGAALAITQDLKDILRAAGFYVKRD